MISILSYRLNFDMNCFRFFFGSIKKLNQFVKPSIYLYFGIQLENCGFEII